MILLPVSLAVAILIAVFAAVIFRLATRARASEWDAEWYNSFSLDVYRPMERLLDPADLAFLESQPGYRPEIGRRLRSERRKIFAGYLSLLVRDYHRLLAIARLMMVYATEDRSDFARALFRQQMHFYSVVFQAHCRLQLWRFGLSGMNPQDLLAALGRMQQQVQGLAAPQPQAA